MSYYFILETFLPVFSSLGVGGRGGGWPRLHPWPLTCQHTPECLGPDWTQAVGGQRVWTYQLFPEQQDVLLQQLFLGAQLGLSAPLQRRPDQNLLPLPQELQLSESRHGGLQPLPDRAQPLRRVWICGSVPAAAGARVPSGGGGQQHVPVRPESL